MDPALLELLRCPVTRQPLRLLPAREAAALGLEARDGLLSADGRLWYAFDEHGFPVLLPGSGKSVPGDAPPQAVTLSDSERPGITPSA